MGGSRLGAPPCVAVASVWISVLAWGCASQPVMDLADNPRLYVPTGYASKLPADRRAFLAPTVDEREPRVVEASGAYPIDYFGDGRWERAPAVMVDEIVRDELASSHVFARIEPTARAEDCLVRVRLRRFDVGAESHVTGFRSFAAIVLRVDVHGPENASGERQLWMSRDFVGAQQSAVAWVPPAATLLMGMSLRQAVASMLASLDQANVGRSNVPLETGS